MEIYIKLLRSGCADGAYRVRAKGCLVAVLSWANENGPLPDWSPFAYVPLRSNGEGTFFYRGQRAIPTEATHIYLRAIHTDLCGTEELLERLPKPGPREPPGERLRLAVISDLHLSSKPWNLRRALLLAQGADGVLCTGDMTNDGLPQQFRLLNDTLEELLPSTPFFPVCGNHDFPIAPLPLIAREVCDYQSLRERALRRAKNLGCSIEADSCGAYSARIGDIDVIGLNAATYDRQLRFSGTDQLQWLEEHLNATSVNRRLILCHAPLRDHNPQRTGQDAQPYFGQDQRLQQIVDAHQNIIFLSGHTHISFNCLGGCVERDEERNNLYINCGSIRPTTLKLEEPVQPGCFADGNIVLLDIANRRVDITAVSIRDGKKISRGYYVFHG